MLHSTTFLIMACVFGLFMAWGIGANDVANAMGTAVGSKALTIRRAIIIAAIFEFAGAFLAGGGLSLIPSVVESPKSVISSMSPSCSFME